MLGGRYVVQVVQSVSARFRRYICYNRVYLQRGDVNYYRRNVVTVTTRVANVDTPSTRNWTVDWTLSAATRP